MSQRWSACLIMLAVLEFMLWVIPAEAQLERLRKLQKEPEAIKGDDAPMVMIAAGEFAMGVDGTIGLDDERPRHTVWLDAYRMDLYEVTTSRYARFLAATGRTPPWLWDMVNPAIHGDRPVIGVDWHDADAYCRWAAKRLPTEAEWEKAARGTDERQFPWGNQAPTAELANFAVGARFSYSQTLMPVGRYEKGKSPFGLFDMAGNAWEWRIITWTVQRAIRPGRRRGSSRCCAEGPGPSYPNTCSRTGVSSCLRPRRTVIPASAAREPPQAASNW